MHRGRSFVLCVVFVHKEKLSLARPFGTGGVPVFILWSCSFLSALWGEVSFSNVEGESGLFSIAHRKASPRLGEGFQVSSFRRQEGRQKQRWCLLSQPVRQERGGTGRQPAAEPVWRSSVWSGRFREKDRHTSETVGNDVQIHPPLLPVCGWGVCGGVLKKGLSWGKPRLCCIY